MAMGCLFFHPWILFVLISLLKLLPIYQIWVIGDHRSAVKLFHLMKSFAASFLKCQNPQNQPCLVSRRPATSMERWIIVSARFESHCRRNQLWQLLPHQIGSYERTRGPRLIGLGLIKTMTSQQACTQKEEKIIKQSEGAENAWLGWK